MSVSPQLTLSQNDHSAKMTYLGMACSVSHSRFSWLCFIRLILLNNLLRNSRQSILRSGVVLGRQLYYKVGINLHTNLLVFQFKGFF